MGPEVLFRVLLSPETHRDASPALRDWTSLREQKVIQAEPQSRVAKSGAHFLWISVGVTGDHVLGCAKVLSQAIRSADIDPGNLDFRTRCAFCKSHPLPVLGNSAELMQVGCTT